MDRVADADRPLAGKRHAIATVTGGQHTIEEVDTTGDCLQHIAWHAHAHQVTRLIGRQERGGQSEDFDHLLVRFPDAEPPDSIARKAQLG